MELLSTLMSPFRMVADKATSIFCERKLRLPPFLPPYNGLRPGQVLPAYCVLLRTENIFVCWCCVGSDRAAGVVLELHQACSEGALLAVLSFAPLAGSGESWFSGHTHCAAAVGMGWEGQARRRPTYQVGRS